MPFFISLVDSEGISWATGPLHSAGNGPTNCLDTDAAIASPTQSVYSLLQLSHLLIICSTFLMGI